MVPHICPNIGVYNHASNCTALLFDLSSAVPCSALGGCADSGLNEQMRQVPSRLWPSMFSLWYRKMCIHAHHAKINHDWFSTLTVSFLAIHLCNAFASFSVLLACLALCLCDNAFVTHDCPWLDGKDQLKQSICVWLHSYKSTSNIDNTFCLMNAGFVLNGMLEAPRLFGLSYESVLYGTPFCRYTRIKAWQPSCKWGTHCGSATCVWVSEPRY